MKEETREKIIEALKIIGIVIAGLVILHCFMWEWSEGHHSVYTPEDSADTIFWDLQ